MQIVHHTDMWKLTSRCQIHNHLIGKMLMLIGPIRPKVNTYSYQTPYPPAYDLILLPNRYKVPDFTKFSRQDDTSTIEHVNRFII